MACVQNVHPCIPRWNTAPFFLEQVEGKSLSSTLTEGLLHFILQKNDRLAPEQSREGPGVMSVLTGRPAANKQHTQACAQFTKITHFNQSWSKPYNDMGLIKTMLQNIFHFSSANPFPNSHLKDSFKPNLTFVL